MKISYLLNNIFRLIILSVILVACKKDHNFRIEGSFRVVDPTPVRLYLLLEETASLVDSVNISEGNVFLLKGMTEHPSIFLLKFFNDQSIYLVIMPGDKIKIDIDNSSHEITYYVEGSYDSKLIKELVDVQRIVIKNIDQLSQDLEKNRDDSLFRHNADIMYKNLLKNHKEFTLNHIYNNPISLSNILALYQNFGRKSQPLFNMHDDVKVFDFVDSNLVVLYPESESVKALNRDVAEAKERIIHRKYFENTIVIGSPLPKLTAQTVSGDTVNIGSNTNKLCLIYFWASWNPYSVDELKVMHELYYTFGAESLNIVTISLDPSEEKLKDFLSGNKIQLPVVCDYHYWDSEYIDRFAVKRIPSVILANKEGIIIAKDIFSSDLVSKVGQVINGK
jgi:peroxiredoxin